ncbi:Gfo/Idh/MocA family protein [Helicobacter cappadocius]|uniref:Gfo/Idh/MocA family oxidoreductase n=1 Tax=Helicobacter cappadocius TaxID=3063998 RepID=A0AA90PRM6_9HELI|nr:MULTISPECIES: Gfo/Idh/MocA family oxidoreductase [unclassified Helicobacter]MDO7252332.1 Gfo/Idh/MocA family oxidoreductase [Helicobacter sp. faydin-H75]MDP2538199.1 Gfo/Idh/MocA family oxidoreductase [Helicobacter sp. faydin-H76]
MKVAIIGYGYWGVNIAKCIFKNPNFELKTIYDEDKSRIQEAKKIYDFAPYENYESILKDDDIQAIFIITPPHSHYSLGKAALKAKKHAFIEKPLTTNIQEAYELYEIAQKNNCILHCDHTFLYSPAVKWLKENIQTFGEIVYINSRRINLGLFQSSLDVIWDLAIHDLSIIDTLVGLKIKKSKTFTKKYQNYPYDAIANINLELQSGPIVTINVSWLSPVKVREMIIGGDKKTAIYDDTKRDKITVFDTGVIIKDEFDKNSLYQKMIEYKLGKEEIPVLENFMALDNSIESFFSSISENSHTQDQKEHILRVIQALEIISKS